MGYVIFEVGDYGIISLNQFTVVIPHEITDVIVDIHYIIPITVGGVVYVILMPPLTCGFTDGDLVAVVFFL